jgi:hypothetical protein
MAKSFFALSRALTVEELVERRRTLVRLGLAWLAMMQVMMFALPGYLRVEAGPNDSLEVLDWAIFLMNWASLTMAVPVMLYSAWPIWRGLVGAVKKRQITMDVPVAISMVAAFIPSTIATMTGHGEVYFDSVTMFIAFLLTARYFEKRAEQSVDDAPLQQGIQMRLRQLCLPLMARADRVATIFVLAQLALSVVVAIVWWYVQPEHVLPVLIALLVMSCPCALSLAAPVSLAATHAALASHPQISSGQATILFAHTRRITYQNLYGALVWHLLTMPLAALGFVTPWIAALAMFVSSMAVMGNAWRLYRIPNEALTDSHEQDYSSPAGLI